MRCNNLTSVHDPHILHDSHEALVAVCRLCKEQAVFRKDVVGRVDNRAYIKFFRRDVLQPHDNLFYKIYPDKMSVS